VGLLEMGGRPVFAFVLRGRGKGGGRWEEQLERKEEIFTGWEEEGPVGGEEMASSDQSEKLRPGKFFAGQLRDKEFVLKETLHGGY